MTVSVSDGSSVNVNFYAYVVLFRELYYQEKSKRSVNDPNIPVKSDL